LNNTSIAWIIRLIALRAYLSVLERLKVLSSNLNIACVGLECVGLEAVCAA
jgi:hypothetical protein